MKETQLHQGCDSVGPSLKAKILSDTASLRELSQSTNGRTYSRSEIKYDVSVPL